MRWLLRLFWGLKHHYTNLCFSPGMVCNWILIHFTSACMEIHVSVHQQFQDPGELCEKVTHASRSEFCLVLSQYWPRMCGHRAQNLLVLRSPQLSLCPDCAGICTDDMQASCLQAKSRRCYLSQNIGLAVTGSARPAPPPLYSGS